MKNKKLLFGILVIAIIAIAGVSLFYHLKDSEFTIAWKSPFIQKREGWQSAVDKTKEKINVGIEAGPIARECFNKFYLLETADYIIEGTVEKVEMKRDTETGIYSCVYLTIEDYIKGKPLPADKLQINVSVRAPYNFTPCEGKKVRIYLRKWSEEDFRIFCGQYGVEEIKS